MAEALESPSHFMLGQLPRLEPDCYSDLVPNNTIVSYAQYAEDITLAQAFSDQTKGFYIDVGAAGPIQHSVTKLFYDKGWSGINIEPVQQLYNALSQQRKRDVNIQAVIDTTEGTEVLYVFPTLPGLTTTDRTVAERHIRSGLPVDKQQVIKSKLETILVKNCQNRIIDFLKIDVEGTEARVLQSFDLKKWQPRVLVIEATEPRTTIQSHQKWEHIVLAAGYTFAQFDGLNRFYALKTEAELYTRLKTKAIGYETLAISQENSKKLIIKNN